MPEIHIHRDHSLGLARARELAERWSEEAEARLGLQCTRNEGETGDTIAFTRSGASGELLVGADHFDLTLKLGILLAAFANRIKSEIEGNLDALLARHEPPPAAV